MSNFDPEKIPIWLRRTPAQQAADQKLQDELRAAQGPGARPNPTEQHLLRAAAVRRSAEAQLQQLSQDPDADPLHVQTARAQLAEALAMQGHFAEAAEIHPDEQHSKRYRRIIRAIDKDDNAPTCNCKVTQENDANGKQVLVTGEHISEMVFSPKHNRMMPLLSCSRCGGMNVKPAPQHLIARIQRVRQEHNAAKGRKQ